MRARSSTVGIASVRATNSATIGTVFCTTSATTTAGAAARRERPPWPFRSQVVRAGLSAMNAEQEQRRAAN